MDEAKEFWPFERSSALVLDVGRGVGCGNFRCDKKECEKGYGQIFHGLLNYWALADGCKCEYVIAIRFRK